MTHVYKKGDRVRLLTDGGYVGDEFHPGALGTVDTVGLVGARIVVDGTDDGALYFSHDEIEPLEESVMEGTLEEIGAKPGDTVEFVRPADGLLAEPYYTDKWVGEICIINNEGAPKLPDGSNGFSGYNTHIWRIVSREGGRVVGPDLITNSTFDTDDGWTGVFKDPKTWGEMTDEEKGALLFEYWSEAWESWNTRKPSWYDDEKYRVKHKPVIAREVRLTDIRGVMYRININIIDGAVDTDSISMEPVNV